MEDIWYPHYMYLNTKCHLYCATWCKSKSHFTMKHKNKYSATLFNWFLAVSWTNVSVIEGLWPGSYQGDRTIFGRKQPSKGSITWELLRDNPDWDQFWLDANQFGESYLYQIHSIYPFSRYSSGQTDNAKSISFQLHFNKYLCFVV